MAIIRSKTKSLAASIPAKLSSICASVFTADAMTKFYDSITKSGKKEILEYLEGNEDEFELDLSVAKSFDCDQGKVTFATRRGYDINIDQIIKLITNGSVTLETVLNCVSSFKDKDLSTALGSKFSSVATEKQTEFLQLKANSEFKEKIACICENKPMSKHVANTEMREADSKDVKAEAKSVKKKSVKKKIVIEPDVAEDLDDILNS